MLRIKWPHAHLLTVTIKLSYRICCIIFASAFALCLPNLEVPENHSGDKRRQSYSYAKPNAILSDTLGPESVVVLSPFTVTTVTTSTVVFVTVVTSPLAEVVT